MYNTAPAASVQLCKAGLEGSELSVIPIAVSYATLAAVLLIQNMHDLIHNLVPPHFLPADVQVQMRSTMCRRVQLLEIYHIGFHRAILARGDCVPPLQALVGPSVVELASSTELHHLAKLGEVGSSWATRVRMLIWGGGLENRTSPTKLCASFSRKLARSPSAS